MFSFTHEALVLSGRPGLFLLLTLIEMAGTVGVLELKDSPPGFELYPGSSNPFSPAQ